MLILAVIALVVAAIALGRGRAALDLPARVVAFAARRLPQDRRVWGDALVAELTAINGRWRRWRFAAGALRISAFPPAQRPASARTAFIVGVLATAAAAAAAFELLPALWVFVTALGLVTSAGAAMILARWRSFPANRGQLAAASLAAGGVLADVGVLIVAAVTHPASMHDPTHAFSLILAATLGLYLVSGVAPASGRDAAVIQWGGIAGAMAVVLASVVVRPTGDVISLVSPVLAAGTLLAATLVGLLTHDRTTAARTGLLAAVLGAPLQFAITIMAQERSVPSTLTNPYDIAAFARGGYPDVTSYLLSDALGGSIVSLLVALPIMYALAALAAAIVVRPTRRREVKEV